MHRQLSLLGPLLALALLSTPVSLQSAPALLWSSQPPSPDATLRFSTLVDQIEPKDLLADFAKSGVPIVAFVQKDLNVEQFAANDAPYVSAIFDNLELHPVLYTNVKTPRNIYSTFKTDASAANENIVIYLPGKSLKENDEFIKSHTEKFNASGPVVFILTGEANEQLKEHKRTRRQAPPAPKVNAVLQTFPKDSPCILVYATGATASIAKKDATKEEPQAFSFSPPTLVEANTRCSTSLNEAGKVELTFKNTDTSKNEDLTLTFDFSVSNVTGVWTIESINGKLGGSVGEFNGDTKWVPIVSNKFSFSCQKTVIPLNETGTDYTGSVVVQAFQLQPFIPGDPKIPRFNDSSDCTVWFTLPIWMGLFVVLLLISILYFGVIALMSIITPDRFENPKGRGLIITNVEE